MADVFSTGVWKSLGELESEELQRLASQVSTSALQCKAVSTTKKYLGAFKRWKAWAASYKLATFPADPVHVTLYLQHLAETKESKAAVEEAVHGLAWAHSLAGVPLPTDLPIVRTTLRGT